MARGRSPSWWVRPPRSPVRSGLAAAGELAAAAALLVCWVAVAVWRAVRTVLVIAVWMSGALVVSLIVVVGFLHLAAG